MARRGRHAAAVTALLAGMAIGTVSATPSAAEDGDVGFRGPHVSGTGSAPTGAKPESKLWFHDGRWWAVMWDEVSRDNYVYRLDSTTHTWARTTTVLDTRAGTRADVLWDGTRLYVASHGFTNVPAPGFPSLLYRLSYDPATGTWLRDAGFPVAINDVKAETLVIDKDATGRLWATWVQDTAVHVATSEGSDLVWGAPFVLPFAEASGLHSDDISSVIAFGGDIGVMWSNQTTATFSFAVHAAGAPATAWTLETALAGPGMADDHINLKTDSRGRVYSAVKTSGTTGDDGLTLLLVREPASAAWSSHVFGTVRDHHTRPIVVVDEAAATLHMFAASPEVGGTIFHKSTPLDAIAFEPGVGDPFVHDSASADMNDPTSTKQTVSAASGLVVLASDDTTGHYWHNVRTSPQASSSASLPPGGRFVDDDGDVHEGAIEAIAAKALTTGCDPVAARYCPLQTVTREQMASFLVRAFELPPADGDHFGDDATSVHQDAINRLVTAGIATGTGDGFQPTAPVARAQMATFLARALVLAPVTADRFTDVAGIHAPNINAIADAGITSGCGSGRYCPDDVVRRNQMATFLARALGLATQPPPSRT